MRIGFVLLVVKGLLVGGFRFLVAAAETIGITQSTVGIHNDAGDRLCLICFRLARTICRWLVGDIKVDVMPTDGAILGFTNRWYESGVAHKIPFLLPDGQNIFILSAPFFVATKLEAFLSRGHDDFRFSSDLEDIIAVIDGRETLFAEVQAAPADLITYLAQHFANPPLQPTFCTPPVRRKRERTGIEPAAPVFTPAPPILKTGPGTSPGHAPREVLAQGCGLCVGGTADAGGSAE